MSTPVDIKVVIGANYGDEGKGLMTDYFASKYKNPLVVCSNGGAQRGHTVVTPTGLRHVFHHFGSGTLCGAMTYLPSSFVVNPMIFAEEYQELRKLTGKVPILYIDCKCNISTPFDMMINQILEECRGEDKHGSCGVGVWETIVRSRNCEIEDIVALRCITKYNFTFNDIINGAPDNLKRVLNNIRKEYVPNVIRENGFEIPEKWKSLLSGPKSDALIEHYIEDVKFLMRYSILVNGSKCFRAMHLDAIIFENAQGLLLDIDLDKKYSTPSHTGLKGCHHIMNDFLSDGIYINNIEVCYVTRSYLTRHGNGPLEDECSMEDISPFMKNEKTNVYNPHQGKFRYAPLNFINTYARCYCDFTTSELYLNYPNYCHGIYTPEIKMSIAATHQDELALGYAYSKHVDYLSYGPTRDNVKENHKGK